MTGPRLDAYGFPRAPQGCTCTPVDRGRWRVAQRRCNHSAFNGCRRTPSAYSEVHCGGCGAVWRTAAGYVDTLPNA